MVVQRWEEWQYRTINNICVRRIMECNNKRKRNYKLTKMPYPLWWRGPVYVLERPNPRTYLFLHTNHKHSHRRRNITHSLPHLRVRPADTSRRVLRPRRSLGMNVTGGWASPLVTVEVLIETTRDKEMVRVKKSWDVMKGTSTVCAAVLHEGRAVGC